MVKNKTKGQSERVKGNYKPSSSSLAADLLSKEHNFNTGIGINFNTFINKSYQQENKALEILSLDNVDLDIHPDILINLKKLSKRNSITKVKALQDIFVKLEDLKENEMENFFKVYVNNYQKFIFDLERKVRLINLNIFEKVVLKIGKRIRPHLKLILPYWIASFYDNKELAEISSNAFKNLFPSDKVQDVLKFAQVEILDLIFNNLFYQTKESLSDSRFYTSDEIEQRYSKIISSTFGVLTYMFENLSSDRRLLKEEKYNEIFDDDKFYSYFKHEDVIIRRSIYNFTLILGLEDPDVISNRLEKYGNYFLNVCFNEQDALNHKIIFESLLVLTKEFPIIWTLQKKPSINKLIKFIEKGCFGSSSIIMNYLELLINYLPLNVLESQFQNFIDAILSTNHNSNILQKDLNTFLQNRMKIIIKIHMIILNRIISEQDNQNNNLFQSIQNNTYKLLSLDNNNINKDNNNLFILNQCIKYYSEFILNLTNYFYKQKNYEAYENILLELEGRFQSILLIRDVEFNEEYNTQANEINLTPEQIVDFIEYIINNNNINLIIKDRFIELIESVYFDQYNLLDNDNELNCFNSFKFICYGYKLKDYFSEEISNLNFEILNLILKNMIYYDINIGLNVVINQLNQNESIKSHIVNKLMETAQLPTNRMDFKFKVELICLILEKIKEGIFTIETFESIENWILLLFNNLLVNQEFYYVSKDSLVIKQDSILLKLFIAILKAPENVFSEELYKGLFKNIMYFYHYFLIKLNDKSREDIEHDELLCYKLTISIQLILKGIQHILLDENKNIYLNRILKYSDFFSEVLLFKFGYLNNNDNYNYNEDDKNYLLNCFNVILSEVNEIYNLFTNNIRKIDHFIISSIYRSLFEIVKGDLISDRLNTSCLLLAEFITDSLNVLYKQSEWDLQKIYELFKVIYPAKESWEYVRNCLLVSSDINYKVLYQFYNIFLFLDEDDNGKDSDDMGIETLVGIQPILEFFKYLFINLDQSIFNYIISQDDVMVQYLISYFSLCLKEYFDEDIIDFQLPIIHNLNLVNSISDLFKHSLLDLSSITDLEIPKIIQSILEINYYSKQKYLIYFSIIIIIEKSILNTNNIHSSWIDLINDLCSTDIKLSSILFNSLSLINDSEIKINLSSIKLDKINQLIDNNNNNNNLLNELIILDSLKSTSIPLQIQIKLGLFLINKFNNINITINNNDELILIGIILNLLEDLLPIIMLQFIKDNLIDNLLNNIINILKLKDNSINKDNIKLYYIKEKVFKLIYIIHNNFINGNITFDKLWSDKLTIIKPILLKSILLENEHNYNNQLIKLNYYNELNLTSIKLLNEQFISNQNILNQLFNILNNSNNYNLIKLSFNLILIKMKEELNLYENQIKDEEYDLENINNNLIKINFNLIEKLKHINNYSNGIQLLSNLLIIYIILYLLESASFKLKKLIINQLQHYQILNNIIELIIKTLQINTNNPFNTIKFNITNIYINQIEPNFISLNLLSSHLLYKLFNILPSLIRSYYLSISNKNNKLLFENYIKKEYSDILINQTLDLLKINNNQQKEEQNFNIKINKNEINLNYLIEDNWFNLKFKISNLYPLIPIEILGNKHPVIPENKWRSWILNSTAIFLTQNGNLNDSINLFKKNLSYYFDGVEECTICYSIVGSLDQSLPNKQCRTCKNKFHPACLFKWFKSSNQSTCPLCRNLF